MKKRNYVYNILFYICFILTMICSFMSSSIATIFDETIFSSINFVLSIINTIMVIIYTFLLIRKYKFKANSLAFPCFYLIFLFLVIFISIIYNDKLIVPYIQFNYYISFVLWNYILFNIYSLLLFSKKGKKRKTNKQKN